MIAMNRKVIKYAIMAIIAIVWVPMVGQNRLVPAVPIDDAGGDDPHGAYMAMVKEYLLHYPTGDSGGYPSFFYMSLPAGSSEYALTFTDDGNVLTLTQAKENLWYHFRPYDKIESEIKIKYSPELVTSYYVQVPDSVMDMLQMLVESAIETSSYLFEKRGYDGTTYCFESSGIAAECWSPNGRCGELVRIFDQCCRAVMNNELDSITVLMPRCREMTASFRMDYPIDLFAVQQRMVKAVKGLYDITLDDPYNYYSLLLESYHVIMEWEGEDEATLQELCDEFKKKHGEDIDGFAACDSIVDDLRLLIYGKIRTGQMMEALSDIAVDSGHKKNRHQNGQDQEHHQKDGVPRRFVVHFSSSFSGRSPGSE